MHAHRTTAKYWNCWISNSATWRLPPPLHTRTERGSRLSPSLSPSDTRASRDSTLGASWARRSSFSWTSCSSLTTTMRRGLMLHWMWVKLFRVCVWQREREGEGERERGLGGERERERERERVHSVCVYINYSLWLSLILLFFSSFCRWWSSFVFFPSKLVKQSTKRWLPSEATVMRFDAVFLMYY